jgi:hypothetical protein
MKSEPERPSVKTSADDGACDSCAVGGTGDAGCAPSIPASETKPATPASAVFLKNSRRSTEGLFDLAKISLFPSAKQNILAGYEFSLGQNHTHLFPPNLTLMKVNRELISIVV